MRQKEFNLGNKSQTGPKVTIQSVFTFSDADLLSLDPGIKVRSKKERGERLGKVFYAPRDPIKLQSHFLSLILPPPPIIPTNLSAFS
jgi:hypothetical protein